MSKIDSILDNNSFWLLLAVFLFVVMLAFRQVHRAAAYKAENAHMRLCLKEHPQGGKPLTDCIEGGNRDEWQDWREGRVRIR